jgi:hypothetical protein
MKLNSILLSTVAAILALLPGTRASADALTDYLGPRELAVGESMRADARGALAITLNPAGLALSRELVFEGTFGHRFEDGANVFTISGCDSTVPIPGCFYYRYLRATPEVAGREQRLRVHEGGAALARVIGEWVYLGINLKYFDYESETGVENSGFAVDAGAVLAPVPILRLAAVGYNLAGATAPHYPRALATGATLRPLPSLVLAFDALWSLDTGPDQSTGRYGGGIEYFLSTAGGQIGYPIRVGSLHDAGLGRTYLTVGAGVLSTKLALDLGARKQLDGDEIVLQASLRVFGPRQVAGSDLYR